VELGGPESARTAQRLDATARPGDAADASVPRARVPLRELSWRFEQGPFGPTDVVIALPASADPAARFPVLVAFHGRGESSKGSLRGARGWLDDYWLGRAVTRLEHPPLASSDFEAYVSAERLEQINHALRASPYAGLIVVCPFLPDVLEGERAWEQGPRLADFVANTLLPRVYAKTPALGTAASTGVDGVSLGGRAALLVGLSQPRAFGSVGSLQAALDASEVERFASLAAHAFKQNPRLTLRLLTSDEDYFRTQNQALSAALGQRAVAHELALVKGTHSYQFNRGPGVLEMLLFHSRVLRGQPPP
jgi:iron(III)-salmochelin esterase